ncbi:MAG: hypothetical protein M3Z04_19495 [Chloroflexota bacterium]|nr:hypothetical protein [Chloroflexota bacterium]
MHRVIVTVKREGDVRVHDLEVPAEIDAGRLAGRIAAALHWDSDSAGQPGENPIGVKLSVMQQGRIGDNEKLRPSLYSIRYAPRGR